MRYYSVKNLELGWFNRPFVAPSDKEAIVLVRNVLFSNPDSELARDRTNAELFFVGNFDADRGRFSGKPELVCKVSDIPVPENKKEGDKSEV